MIENIETNIITNQSKATKVYTVYGFLCKKLFCNAPSRQFNCAIKWSFSYLNIDTIFTRAFASPLRISNYREKRIQYDIKIISQKRANFLNNGPRSDPQIE